MIYNKKQRTGLCISTAMCLVSTTLTLQAAPYQVETTMQLGSRASSTSTALLPYYHRNNKSAFVVGQYQANNNNSNSIASAGLGYRHLFGNQLVIGGYVFGDLLHTNDQRKHYVLSPGMNIQTDTLHFNTNVYIPIGSKQLTSTKQYFSFKGYTASGKDYNIYEQSMLGVDAMLSYTPKTKYIIGIGIGGYHYRAKKSDIKQQAHLTGIKGRLAYQPFDRITLSGEYRYDKENKSRYMLNIGLNLSPGQQNISMSDKLNSAIDRNMNLNTTEQGMALEEQNILTGTISQVYNNVHFVHGTLGSSSGTGEHHSPHSSLEDALAASASKDSPHIWLAGDHTYTKASENVTVNADNTTIMARSSNFQTATKGSDANAAVVQINDGGLVLSNGSHLEGFKLETVGSSAYNSGDWVASMNYGINNNTSQVVSIKDMFIASAVANSSAIKDVASILNYGTINFSGSNTIGATVGSNRGDGYAHGIINYDGGSSSFTSGTNTITATTEGSGNDHWAIGIYNYINSSSSFTGGTNTIAATTEGSDRAFGIYNYIYSSSAFTGGTNDIKGTAEGSGNVRGINNSTNSSSTFTNGTNTITATTATTESSGYALGVANYVNSSSIFTGGTNDIKATAEGDGTARGINNSTNSSSTFTNGTNTITATTATTESSGYALGVANYVNSSSSFADSTTTIAATANNGGKAFGMYNHDNNSSSTFANGTNIITATATATTTAESSGYAYGIYNYNGGSFGFTGESNTIRAIADPLTKADPYYGSGSHTVTGGEHVTCKSGTNETNLYSINCEFPPP